MRTIDLVGKVFNRLTVISRCGTYRSPSGKTRILWRCLCECGNYKDIYSENLRSGNSGSCGCLHKEVVKKKVTKTGMSTSRMYNIWYHMKRRCSDPNHKVYHHYGGRGITYDPDWNEFENFYEDMRHGYSKELTLDRVDNDKGYNKDNCRWTTYAKQARNQRKPKTNTSGKVGVGITRLGGLDKYYTATWYDISGNKYSKHFSIDKLGSTQAFELACIHRDMQIILLNKQGAGYTDKHGK